MNFDIADLLGSNVRKGQRFTDNFSLPLSAQCGIAHLGRAIIVDCRPFDDGIDMILALNGIAESFQNHDPQPTGTHRSLTLSIEGTAISIRGKNAALLIVIATF